MKRIGLVVLVGLLGTVPVQADESWLTTPKQRAALRASFTAALAPEAAEQDLQTLLSYFLRDLYAGTWGSSIAPKSLAITNTALGTTSTDGLMVTNTTLATAGVSVQISPRSKWCGTAYNSVSTLSETNCFFLEVLPATVAGTTTATLKIGYIAPGGAVTYPGTLTSGGSITALSNIIANANFIASINNGLVLHGGSGAAVVDGGADKIIHFTDNSTTTGMELTVGSTTLGTCTGGTIVTGSHNFAGGYTGNSSASCVVNFGTPTWTNAPFCHATSRASATHPHVTAVSTTSVTFTGGVSGEQIDYFCFGRIGT